MKKLTAIFSVVALIACIAVIFTACGTKDEELTTTTDNPTEQRDDAMEDGMVTDESESGDNGALGDIVTDVSDGVSDIMTDVSEDISEVAQ